MEPPLASSSINSKSTAIKTILLAAWRAKLSNEEWENRIRKILPRGVNGDVYDLADCLLKQALVGPIPNQLFISYLKHAVKCELVSHGAVLSSIAHQSTTHLKQQTTSSTPQQTTTTPTNLSSQTSPSLSILNRTSPIICLLDFLKTFRDRISCKGSEIECLNLCHSINQLLHWLLKCIQNSIEFMMTTTNSQSASSVGYSNLINTSSSVVASTNINQPGGLNQVSINLTQHEATIRIIDLCTETIHYFIDRPFMKSLLFISKIEYGKEFEEILKIVQQIQQRISMNSNLQSIQDKLQYFSVLQQLINTFNSRDMHPSVLAAQQLRCLQQHRIRSTQIVSGSNFERKIQQTLLVHDSTTNYALFNSLYSLIACDATLRPARSPKLLAKQISIITKFNSAPINMTYCEIIRVCMIGFIDSFGAPAKVKWAFFTFLKMPKLLIELSKVSQLSNDYESHNNFLVPSSTTPTNQVSPSNFINDLNLAFERLCEYSPLLDEADCKSKCDFLKCIVKELVKNEPSLAQELRCIDLKKYSSKRISHNVIDNNNSGVNGNALLKTEPVVTTILQLLNSPVDQNPTELFEILGHLVSGKQFEFTLSAAASTGRLQLFVKKLIDHNELNIIPKSQNFVKSSLIFDITFLILAYIAQQYGAEVIDYDNQRQNTTSTFMKWFHDCHNPSSRINCPKEMLKNSNPEIVSSLIKQILRSDENGGGLEMKSVNWRDVCTNLPKAISEILNAWSQGTLDESDMKLVVEHIKSKMCFAAVVAATWLQAHIRTLNESEKSKPLALLQTLTKASSQAKQQEIDDPVTKNRYSERSSLMCSVIRKIYFEMAPKSTNSSQLNLSTISSSIINNGTTTSITGAGNDNNNCDESSTLVDETSYQSINDKFASTLTAQEIFLSNVKLCLSRGWIDHKSLVSMNSLFKMIGGECWTNLIVEQILTSHESPSDLSRAVNITYGLFHLDIEACAFALLRDTIPSWLMGEKKQTLLSQPRAFALAHLTVMTIIEVYSNLKASQSNAMRKNSAGAVQQSEDRKNQLSSNGVKQESIKQSSSSGATGATPMDIDKMNNGAKEIKRIKLTHHTGQDGSTATGSFEKVQSNNQTSTLSDLNDRLSKLNECISNLMRLFKEIMSDSVISQRTLFPVLFLQQTVVCTREGSTVITGHLQPEILLDIINLFSSELTFELVLAISNLSTSNSRKYAAKAMCQLAQVKESKQQQKCSSSSSGGAPAGASSSTGGGGGSSSANPPGQQQTVAANNLGVKTIIASSTPMLIG